jgi:hypothetical protein
VGAAGRSHAPIGRTGGRTLLSTNHPVEALLPSLAAPSDLASVERWFCSRLGLPRHIAPADFMSVERWLQPDASRFGQAGSDRCPAVECTPGSRDETATIAPPT